MVPKFCFNDHQDGYVTRPECRLESQTTPDDARGCADTRTQKMPIVGVECAFFAGIQFPPAMLPRSSRLVVVMVSTALGCGYKSHGAAPIQRKRYIL